MVEQTNTGLSCAIQKAYEAGLRHTNLPTPVADEPAPLDVVGHQIGSEARDATAQLLEQIGTIFGGCHLGVVTANTDFILHYEYIARWLMYLLSNGISAKDAANRLNKFFKGRSILIEQVVFVNGIHITSKITLTNSIYLEPYNQFLARTNRNNSYEHLHYFKRDSACLSFCAEINMTLVKYKVKEGKISERNIVFEETSGIDQSFATKTEELHDMVNLLSLASCGPIVIVGQERLWDPILSPLGMFDSRPSIFERRDQKGVL